jgi:hypothetical protein
MKPVRDPRTGELLPDVPMKAPDEKPGLWDKPRNVKRLIRGFLVVCLLVLLVDLAYTKHVHYPEEGWFGFYAFYGFISCVTLVLVAKGLRLVLHRPEDWYDD